MTPLAKQVKKFMLRAHQVCPEKPTIPDIEIIRLRLKLIAEEFEELAHAFGFYIIIEKPEQYGYVNLVKVADAIADLQVVVEGAGIACGLDMEPITNEVCRSNMTKFIDGYKRADGKWIKGKSWEPPKIKEIIEQQQGM